jgi:hypothetical protein
MSGVKTAPGMQARNKKGCAYRADYPIQSVWLLQQYCATHAAVHRSAGTAKIDVDAIRTQCNGALGIAGHGFNMIAGRL